MRHLYLDYNATTPIAPSVQQTLLPFLAEHFGNPSSSHALGRAAHEALEDARGHVASLLGTGPDEVVFTGGGTESNNLALKGVAFSRGTSAGGHLVITAVEHPSVVQPARFLERLGYDVTVVPVTSQGVVQPEAIARALRPDTLLVSVMLANNETGAIQPLKQIGDLCHAEHVPLHTDASQAVGKIRVQVDELGVDLLTIAGHKMYAPKGVGALYVRQGVALEPALHGAGHEAGLRAGTENVAYIAALGAAAALAGKSLDASQERLLSLRDRLLALLREGAGEKLTVHSESAPRLPNTLSISFPRATGHELLARIPELCASTGSACHSQTPAMSPTLAAMGVSSEV
ncbi:MAG TPA: cysteine desulfurase family protein, partial [Pirellulaceae bacterium]|nr:cysteine desulfurase family protein [Pirellulaceae bacterium]